MMESEYSEETCPSVALSIADPTWPDPVYDPSRPGGMPVTNRLSCRSAPDVAVSPGYAQHYIPLCYSGLSGEV
jgi:hypothetical protein